MMSEGENGHGVIKKRIIPFEKKRKGMMSEGENQSNGATKKSIIPFDQIYWKNKGI